MSRRSTRRKTAQQRSNRSTHSSFSTGRQFHRQLRLEPLEDRRLLAITVTTLADTVDFNDGVTSLREAIFAANTVPGADTIEFAPALTANGHATILLTHGELKITDSLAINGPGAVHLSIAAAAGTRILNVDDILDEECEVSITGLSFDGTDVGRVDGAVIFNRENLALVECVIENGRTSSNGGGVFSTSGDVSLLHTTVRNNLALGSGGGIYLVDGALEIFDSTILGNRAPNLQGGGLAIYDGQTEIVRTTIDGNEAFAGGGVFHQDGRLQVVESQISGNTAWGGGGMRISRSEIEVTDSTFVDNRATYREGGGIRALQTKISITGSLFDGNSARDGGALWSYDSETNITDSNLTRNSSLTRGGAVTTYGGALTVQGTTIVENSCKIYGGGISTASSNASFLGCKIAGNDAGVGGGIWSGGALTLVNTLVRNNSASHAVYGGGGGLWCISGEVLIDRSDVSDNRSELSGGGIYIHDGSLILNQSQVSGNESNNRGGGIYTRFAHFAAENSTISGNRATVFGGGIFAGVAGHEASLDFTTISSNTAGEGAGGIYLLDGYLKLNHSIVATNAAPSGPDLERFFVAEYVPHHSLVGDVGAAPLSETVDAIPDANGNLIGGPTHGVIDPLLGPLADNGGFELPDGSRILTHALLPGSPAINAGDVNATAGQGGVPEFDQRGEPFGRIVGGRIDIGAFEYQTPTDLHLLVDTLADESDGDYSRGDLSLREAIELANKDRFEGVIDTIQFDPALTAGGPATILLTKGELKITDSLTIEGPGANLLMIDASGNDPTPAVNNGDGSRILNAWPTDLSQLTEPPSLKLRQLTFTGGDVRGSGGAIQTAGDLQVFGSKFVDNVALGSGGAISVEVPFWLQKEVLLRAELADCEFTRNVARVGNGGALAIEDDEFFEPSTVLVSNSDFVENEARSDGGGVFIAGRRQLIDFADSTFDGNSATYGGGAFIRSFGDLRVDTCEFLENHARNAGGGFSAGTSHAIVEDTLVHGNVADNFAGGLSLGSNAEIINSTISDNVGEVRPAFDFTGGGGIVASHDLVLRHSTVTGNLGGGVVAVNVALDHTIVAENRSQSFLGSFDVFASVTLRSSLLGSDQLAEIIDLGGSLIGTTTDPIDPLLGPLADNGGPTRTHALLPGSPAINAGDAAAVAGQGGVPTHDQRGAPFTRVYGGRIDIGAVESIPEGFLPGDYVVDGVVDARDYIVWRDSLGAGVPPGSRADGNGDGVVDERDYAVWKSNFGATVYVQATLTATPTASVGSPLVVRQVAQVPASPLDNAPQLPARSGVRGRNAEIAWPNYQIPRERALEAWLSQRRFAIQHVSLPSRSDSELDVHGITAVDVAFDQLATFATRPGQSRWLGDVCQT